jgi:hypothetical protein
MVGKMGRGWQILMMNGFYSGAQVLISPDRHQPQLIGISVSDTSRLEQLLTKISAIVCLVMTAPFFILAVLRVRLLFALILCVPILLVLALVLTVISLVICRLFKPLDHYFDEGTKSQILAVANGISLPTTLDRSAFPTPPPPPPAPMPIPALPERRGPFGIKS